MAVYDLNGVSLSRVYDISANTLSKAYSINGSIVFSDDADTVDYSNNSYSVVWTNGRASTQGFAIYDDKVFWVSKSGNSSVPASCYVFNLSDGSQALDTNPITIHSGHGNSISIAYPKLYASTAYNPPLVYVNTLASDFTATLEKTLYINDGCVALDVCVDEHNKNIIWTNGHYESEDNPDVNIISKWDVTKLTLNLDGTYTPKLLRSAFTPKPVTFLPDSKFYLQGCTFHDGMLWYANGYSGTDSKSYVVAVNPVTGVVQHVIYLNTTAEPEGVQFYPDENSVGGYAMYVGFQNQQLKKYIFLAD